MPEIARGLHLLWSASDKIVSF